MKAFNIHIDSAEVLDLKLRLATTRWPDEVTGSGWEYGTSLAYLKELCGYWEKEFDWNAAEQFLNTFSHYKTEDDGAGIHFIYEKGKGLNNKPLLLIHGWPDSFFRFIKLIPLLTAPDENGDAFDVIVPSIPGFGFSDRPTAPGAGPDFIAAQFNRLMTETLGYDSFYVHGGDWGASIATRMAATENSPVTGLHLTNVPPELFFTADFKLFGDEEKAYLQSAGQAQKAEGGYLAIQSSKPQTLTYGLNDSPAGLASWIIEKFHSWSDNKGHIENSFSKDELLANLSIYWFTQTAGSAARIYYEAMRQPPLKNLPIAVPAYFAIFPGDSIKVPEVFARRVYDVQAWATMPEGGHFPALETPDSLAWDIRRSLADLSEVRLANTGR